MDRLTKTEWLDHGLKALSTNGFTALKADKLAKSLGVSRGSFYWHFKNLADFHAEVLARWQTLTVAHPISTVEAAEGNDINRLEVLIQVAAEDNLQLERAVRSWAESNEAVKRAVKQVDVMRVAHLERYLLDIGLSKEKARARAYLIYYAFLGQMIFYQDVSADIQQKVIDELIALTTQTIL